MNLQKIKNIPIVTYLKKIGISPISENHYRAMFLAPYRKDTKPSLKVDKIKNLWIDYGDYSKKGSILDLIMVLQRCNFKTAINILINNDVKSFSFHCKPIECEYKSQYQIRAKNELKSDTLIKYLRDRKLDINFCKKYCKELVYTMNGKRYFGVAFENNLGGYEIRNLYFKGCLIKKDITTISYRSDRIRLFESWSDFLSYLTLYPSDEKTSDYIILNSVALVDKCLSQIASYRHVELFLDHDSAGIKATRKIINLYPSTTIDKSFIYEGYSDVNEYLKHHNPFAL